MKHVRRLRGAAAAEIIVIFLVMLIIGVNIWALFRPNDDDLERRIGEDLLKISTAMNLYRASNDTFPDGWNQLPKDLPRTDPLGRPYRLMWGGDAIRSQRLGVGDARFNPYLHAIVKCDSLKKTADTAPHSALNLRGYKGSAILGGFIEGYVTYVPETDDWERAERISRGDR